MTEIPSEQPHPQPQIPIAAVDPSSLEYWCYVCDKVVLGETHADHPGIVCQECENWYIEFIGPPPPLPTSLASFPIDQRSFGKQFLQALRRFSRLAPDDDDPPPQIQPSSSAIQIVQVFGLHCLYVLCFISQVGDRGVVAPPSQQFLFDVGNLRSRSLPSFTFNPIDELRAGVQFLCMLRLISQGAPDDDVPPNQQPSVVDEASDQTPFCTPLYSFLLEERTFGGRFLRMLCLITQIARDEEVESPNQLLTDWWDLVEQIIGLYEPENLFDDSNEVEYLGQEEEDNNDHGIEGHEIERRVGGNLARLDRERWANIEAGIEVPDRDEDQSANFRGGYEYDEDEDGYEIRDETGGYVGNPGDYLDAAAYETLLQILAENVDGARPGAPPASKGVVEALETLRIKGEGEILACAICQDTVNIGETVKKLPCRHGYHEDCIVPWLGSRNSCPLCRYELPTDYLDYEEKRKRKAVASAAAESSSSRGTSGDGDGGDESQYDTEDGDGGGDSYSDTDFLL